MDKTPRACNDRDYGQERKRTAGEGKGSKDTIGTKKKLSRTDKGSKDTIGTKTRAPHEEAVSASTSPADDVAGQREYAKYMEAQLAREEERKKWFEARGVTVITTSGTLATLLLGLIAIATKSTQTFTLPDASKTPLGLALVAFAVAALLAIFTNVPRSVDEADPEGLTAFARRLGDVDCGNRARHGRCRIPRSVVDPRRQLSDAGAADRLNGGVCQAVPRRPRHHAALVTRPTDTPRSMTSTCAGFKRTLTAWRPAQSRQFEARLHA